METAATLNSGSNGENTARVLLTIRDMKSCPKADIYIEIFINIYWISAPNLTLAFLCCILWKIWLWTAITASRKSTCRSGRTIFLCGAERRACSGCVQWLFSAPTSWLCSTVVFFFKFSCIQHLKIKAFHPHWPTKRGPWEAVAWKKKQPETLWTHGSIVSHS